MKPTQASLARLPRSRFFLSAGLLVVGLVLAGFGPIFLAELRSGLANMPLLLHVHAVLMGLWLAIFLLQVALIMKGQAHLHRKLGKFGAALAVLVVVVGIGVALSLAKRSMPDDIAGLSFLATSFGDLLIFAALIIAGLLMRRRSDWHSRLMLLANLSLLAPAIARIPLDFIRSGPEWLLFVLHDAVLLVIFVADGFGSKRARFSVHPAFIWGGLLILLAQPLRFIIGATDGWIAFARFLLA